jgi:hypothetical protein
MEQATFLKLSRLRDHVCETPHKLWQNRNNGIMVRKFCLAYDNLPRPGVAASSSARPFAGELSLQNKDKYGADALNRGLIDTKPKGFAP